MNIYRKDVVRHPLVQQIIKAYAKYDEEQEKRRNKEEIKMVELILENEQDKEELTPEIEKAIKDVCVAVMEEEECDFDAEISVTLVDNDTIRSINKEQRDIDRATDVLSFPNAGI